MRNFRYIILCTFFLFFTACELDNFEGPKAGISGKIIDKETGELVEQDIIQGTRIELTEHGYDPVAKQYLVIKNNGTYENSKLFENTYTIQPVNGNFIPIEPQEVEITPNTVLNFEVTPYLRIKDAEFTKEDGNVIVTFRIEQNVTLNIHKIGLYVFTEPEVGEPIHTLADEQVIDRVVPEDETFTLKLNIDENTSQFESPKNINELFFRVGALIDIGEAKFNYAPTVSFEFDV